MELSIFATTVYTEIDLWVNNPAKAQLYKVAFPAVWLQEEHNFSALSKCLPC